MLNEQDLKGIYVPVVTPFLPSTELDIESYRNYLGKLLEQDIQGLVINGTTGESPTVSWDEVVELVQTTKASMLAKHSRMPIVIGTGTNDTVSTVKRTEWAGQLGADAVMVIVPYYNRPSQEGIIEHFRKVAEVGVPVIAYEVPARTGVRLTADTTLRIMELDGVIGLKDSSGGTALVSELTSRGSKPVLCGDDIYFHTMLSQGAAGGILASANINTQDFINVFRLASQGDFKAAKKAFDPLAPLIAKLFQEPNPAPLKWLLAQQGVISSGTLRLPMVPITKSLQLELEQTMQNLLHNESYTISTT
ncbi:4-hydroxy-tetrahydrodipicolinate synthase [Paenibacillus sp. GSMTC-2017]|uniref:4-hydroxy-tetrahydrodipicolinate synthase n=1 Tax=Paenibacillus sp. GSMTC-2017 TaxID=2794350 RepID=UPI0018D93DF3|nr:4-hydroxy-tetrahydrodipicolinate synthase [Paenibacillus sp. GSMTC-2017]MBH5317104.1 4-hydroxy-tetrahydrodipicolinate synthase [Paenibacillus sp. GSMTC-2017]